MVDDSIDISTGVRRRSGVGIQAVYVAHLVQGAHGHGLWWAIVHITTEFVLFVGAARGGAQRRQDTTWRAWRRPYLASGGPDTVRNLSISDMVEQASPGPYVELFARRSTGGWECGRRERQHRGHADMSARRTTVPLTPREMLAAAVIIGGLTLSCVLLVGLLFVSLYVAVQIGGEILYVLKGLLPHG